MAENRLPAINQLPWTQPICDQELGGESLFVALKLKKYFILPRSGSEADSADDVSEPELHCAPQPKTKAPETVYRYIYF